MMGAPTVMVEKIPSGEEAIAAFEAMEEYLAKRFLRRCQLKRAA